MGLFGNRTPIQPPRPDARAIPQLDPDYFESIRDRLVGSGGSATVTDVAASVANAIYNTGLRFLQNTNRGAARDFEKLYEGRGDDDRSAADRMIDFLVAEFPDVQGKDGFVSTLLARLDDVLSRPA